MTRHKKLLAELMETDMPMYSKMELGARRVKRDQVPKLIVKVSENGAELKPIVFALFSQNE